MPMRLAVLNGNCDEKPALTAVENLTNWPADRVSHRDLARPARQYHRTVRAYDALYIVTARAHALPFLTTFGRRARVPSLGMAVQQVRLG